MTSERGVIRITNVEFQARHGATAAERKLMRRFQVDVEIEADLGAAVASDRLVDTIDYHGLCALVIEVGTARTYHLIEALAGAILHAIQGRVPGGHITVEVRKLNPPCPGGPTWAAARLSTAR